MNALSPIQKQAHSIARLVDRASDALAEARTSAEVLDAREKARVAYDASKSARRVARAKQAHDSLVQQIAYTQAQALTIRAEAEMRLAEEYDAAQERGDISKQGAHVVDGNMRTADLGLRREEIHEARKLRNAEQADPGLVERTVNDLVERGEEPTRAALYREIAPKPKPKRTLDPRALWLWGCIKDFEREGVLNAEAAHLISEMTPPMIEDLKQKLPGISAFLMEMEGRL